MLMSCRHNDIKEYYTARHDEAGRKLTRVIGEGGVARYLTLTNFGRVDGGPEDTTVPSWLLGAEARRGIQEREAGDRGLKPDMIILEGWPDNVRPPEGPVRKWVGANGHARRVVVHIVELGFSSDFKHQDKYEAKQSHYRPLATALAKEGWRVYPRTHVLTVGVRATVPERNDEVLKELGVHEKSKRVGLQHELVRVAAKHAGIIVAKLRRLHGKARRAGGKARTGTQHDGRHADG
jgi:hypothetical protein